MATPTGSVERVNPGKRPGAGRQQRPRRRTLSAQEKARRAELRAATRPAITYPSGLPVVEVRDLLAEAIAANQVVIVAGATGSGKTTQLPKICMELGHGLEGMIGHTQPRRIAARSVAERIASELGIELGGAVGYAVRFNDRVSDATSLKLMTDGILLAELGRDPELSAYDTIIVDEAHERSLNIDFLIGYLSTLIKRRPDLKVIITSATIDTERFAAHFGDAPVIEVSGRTYPVEVRWEPVVEDGSDAGRDQTEAICDAVAELLDELPGDVLVFLSGEREIRDTAQALEEFLGSEASFKDKIDVLPLYARLSAADQYRVFRNHTRRRVVLATNVAETSITVPGIRGVVDPGTARISRYNARTKVQSLPIEPISQASADQRAGRCGRVGPGVCIRLYSEADYQSRPRFTDPEIVRTNLASVILQMTDLGLGDVASFPFVDPPDARQVTAGLDLLGEVGAITGEPPAVRLTGLGRKMARLPLDPRMSRMLLDADRYGCLAQVIVIAAALSIADPRETPADKREIAVGLHRRFEDPNSDFVAYLNLWDYLRERQHELSGNQFRKLLRAEMISFQRVREWQDLVTQLRQACREIGLKAQGFAPHASYDPGSVHRAVLAGLLSHIGRRLEPTRSAGAGPQGKGRKRPEVRRGLTEFQGARGTKFAIGRSSGLARRPPAFVVAAELIDTGRLWARTAASIEPVWAERLAGDLLVRSYSEPRWDPDRGAVVADETATLYGVPVVQGRKVDFARHDPELARELFIVHALIGGEWRSHWDFIGHNAASAEVLTGLEARARRIDLLADRERLAELYAQRLPPEVNSKASFDRWYRRADKAIMRMSPADLLNPGTGGLRLEDFPDAWVAGSHRFELSYVYDPTAEDDGVTVRLPLTALNDLGGTGFDWQIPGNRTALVEALIRTVPRKTRMQLGSIAQAAAEFVAFHVPEDGPLLAVLGAWLARRLGLLVHLDDADLEALSPWLRLRFEITDPAGRVVASGRDLPRMLLRLDALVEAAVAAAHRDLERDQVTDWDFGSLPARVSGPVGFPGLVAREDGTAGIRVFAYAADRDAAAPAGLRALVARRVHPPVAKVAKSLPNDAKLALGHAPGGLERLLADCATAAIDGLIASAGGTPTDRTGWDLLLNEASAGAGAAAERVVTRTAVVLGFYGPVTLRVERVTAGQLQSARLDMEGQLERLVHPGFVTAAGAGRLLDLVRYLRGMQARLDRIGGDPLGDRERMRTVQHLQAELESLTGGRSVPTGWAAADQVWWMLEELRVSLWAQTLGTPRPVSAKRVEAELDRLAESSGWGR